MSNTAKSPSPTSATLEEDIRRVLQIPIVNTILDVVASVTGMGFAAVARVTRDRWIACCVRDDINFGLKPGGELKVETTICNDIRDTHELVVIDDVSKDEIYINHHTPKQYGFKSYISVPIMLKDGQFFGTLCAIDPNPARLNNPKTIGMFTLFAELLAFHLESIDIMERSTVTMSDLNRSLTATVDENRQYHHVSHHNIQEPLRKMRIYSNMLVTSSATNDRDNVKDLALKINNYAQRVSMMISDLSGLAELNPSDAYFETVDLNDVVKDVLRHLKTQIDTIGATIEVGPLPVLKAIPFQMEQLFYHLLGNALKFSKADEPSIIRLNSKEFSGKQLADNMFVNNSGGKYVEITLQDNGIGIDEEYLPKIFELFMQSDKQSEGHGVGLAYCRKITRNHYGFIDVKSEAGKGTTFTIVLPVDR